MVRPATLARDISPPPVRRVSTVPGLLLDAKNHPDPEQEQEQDDFNANDKSEVARIEAHELSIRDHLSYFVSHLSQVSRPTVGPRVPIDAFRELYQRNQHSQGAHFVVHQHDHPVAGLHYDLRLQFSDSSTISFAIPYGLPGNPNSKRPNRMAIETRVHNLWNNLIESASHATGSLLIWDTGQYENLPRPQPKLQPNTDDEISDIDDGESADTASQSQKLFEAFQSRHMRIRLHGTRLPKNYTIALRLPSANNKAAQPKRPKRKRRRADPFQTVQTATANSSEGESDAEAIRSASRDDIIDAAGIEAANASEDDEDGVIRSNNAYTGANNTIGSIHQRHWFLTLDRSNSGFTKARSGPDAGRWIGSDAFFVRGRDHERSIVTGRLADDVMADEGVEKFMRRKMWRPILE
ncbi:hypothetical protein AC579_6668 [Pseudocercospora musae]|uniref:DNA ligase D 3'-phosphoesterase domain-containing protein n=1 Tax=Pseudocercospora musae TaxID=113226 RepID=A0A139IPC5_9PEZI|nr:hypothetical protein AC579_6668 [Pseudocercospora musae]